MATVKQVRALIDADPQFFKPDGATDLQPDGYVATGHIETLFLNRYGEMDNPDPAPQIPAKLDELEAAAAAPQTFAALPFAQLVEIGARIRDQDRVSLRLLFAIISKTADKTEMANISKLLDATVDDPNHPAKVPAEHIDGLSALISEALGRPLEMSGIIHPKVEEIIGRKLTADEQTKRDEHFALVAEQVAAADKGLSVEAFRDEQAKTSLTGATP